MCTTCMQELGRIEESIASSGTGLQAVVNSKWVLGTETGFSARAVSALNHRDLSPASRGLILSCKAHCDTDMLVVLLLCTPSSWRLKTSDLTSV